MYSSRIKIVRFLLVTLLGTMLLTFVTAYAQQKTYQPLLGIPIPGGNGTLGSGATLPQYINAVYIMLIGLGAIFGVIKIVFAGVKYSLSDIVTDKSDAREDIKGVLLGLGILLIPFIVLNTIYPSLTSLDVLQSAPTVRSGINTSQTNTSNRTAEQMCLANTGSRWVSNTCCSATSNTGVCAP